MRREIAAAWLLLTVSAAAIAPEERLADPALETRARAISRELRCVVCQSESIDESNAPLAADLRRLVRERLAAGDSDAAVRAFVVERYGDFVLLKPRIDARTIALWVGPAALLLLGGAVGWSALRGVRAAPAPPPLSAEEEEALRRLQP